MCEGREREGILTFVREVFALVILLDDPIDVAHCRADEERKDEGDDMVATSPNVDVDGLENQEEGEAP